MLFYRYSSVHTVDILKTHANVAVFWFVAQWQWQSKCSMYARTVFILVPGDNEGYAND